MQISDEGVKPTIPAEAVRLNKSFEGFHKRRPDGKCEAYQTLLGKSKVTGKPIYDIPTCGYGTTKNVRMGMVWTEEYATERMMEDLAEAAAFVDKAVKVAINDNERSTLILFTNNCGPGNLAKLVKPLNNGDRIGTANLLQKYTRAQGIVMPGLVSRRAREAALFLKPVEAPEAPAMPQTVSEAKEVSKPAIAVGAAAVATAAPAVLSVPAVPDAITQTVTQVEAWKTMGIAVWTLKAWAMAEPILASGLAISMGGFYVWSRKQGAK